MICEMVSDVLCEVFCGWVERVEGWGFVEVVVREGVTDFYECFFEEVEVAEEPLVVEL